MARPTSPRRRFFVARGALIAVLTAFLLASACGQAGASAAGTPADFGGIVQALNGRGIVVDTVVSGDPGCDDRDLTPTAISFRAHGLDQAQSVPVHVYLFRDDATDQRLRSRVDTCARSYVSDPDGYVSIDASPFVLTGQGPWGAQFVAALRAALSSASTGGR